MANQAYREPAERWGELRGQAAIDGRLSDIEMRLGQLHGELGEVGRWALHPDPACLLERRIDGWSVETPGERRLEELGGGIGFDREARTVTHRTHLIHLSPRETELLAFLIPHPGRSRLASTLAVSPPGPQLHHQTAPQALTG